MTFEKKFPNGRFKFSRTGILGKGDRVNVYMNGEKIDDFYLDSGERDAIKECGASYFENLCNSWYYRYGYDL